MPGSFYLRTLFTPGWTTTATAPVLAATFLAADGDFFSVPSAIFNAYDRHYSEPLIEAAGIAVGGAGVIWDGSG